MKLRTKQNKVKEFVPVTFVLTIETAEEFEELFSAIGDTRGHLLNDFWYRLEELKKEMF